jgi:hypothetical protein
MHGCQMKKPDYLTWLEIRNFLFWAGLLAFMFSAAAVALLFMDEVLYGIANWYYG